MPFLQPIFLKSPYGIANNVLSSPYEITKFYRSNQTENPTKRPIVRFKTSKQGNIIAGTQKDENWGCWTQNLPDYHLWPGLFLPNPVWKSGNWKPCIHWKTKPNELDIQKRGMINLINYRQFSNLSWKTIMKNMHDNPISYKRRWRFVLLIVLAFIYIRSPHHVLACDLEGKIAEARPIEVAPWSSIWERTAKTVVRLRWFDDGSNQNILDLKPVLLWYLKYSLIWGTGISGLKRYDFYSILLSYRRFSWFCDI